MNIFSPRRPQRPADTTHPYPWFSAADPKTRERGAPLPFDWWQARPLSPVDTAMQHPLPAFFHSRQYSRGADAYAPQFGQVFYNPIGNGVVSTDRLPTIAGPGARYQFGAIYFNAQDIPTSFPGNPTVPKEVVDAMLAQAQSGAMYATSG